MDIFIGEATTKNNIRILLCGLCESGSKIECFETYLKGISDSEFKDTNDEYILDLRLMEMMVSFSDRRVKALGASIFREGVVLRSGGIIGDPFEEAQSADDEIELIGDSLYCIAFSGRFGVVFEGTLENAKAMKKSFLNILDNKNEHIIPLAIKELNLVSQLYILVSDGSGDGGYPYVCAKKGKEFYEKSLKYN